MPMKMLVLSVIALVGIAVLPHPTTAQTPVPDMKKATPLITVQEIEPCLDFWTGLGFEITATVPHEDRMGFAMLLGGGVEIMYQSHASIVEDLGRTSAESGFAGLVDEIASSTTTLFIEVEALDPIIGKLGDASIVVPRRETFYGMDEIFVKAPCGTLVGFAAPVEGGGEGSSDGSSDG